MVITSTTLVCWIHCRGFAQTCRKTED